MNKAEQIAHKNLVAKLEKALAKLDMVEQENQEYKKEVSKLKTEKEILEKNNTKLGQIATKRCDELYNEIAKLNQEVVAANDKKKEDAKTIKKLEKTIEKLKDVISDLKASKIKNSTNSSKPSSTNGYKRVIQNNRVKSGKLKGGQKGREGKTLKVIENVDEIKDIYGEKKCECGGQIIYEIEYIKKQLIDIENSLKTIEHRYHKGVCKKCGKEYKPNIPKELANPVQYSSKLKIFVPMIKNISNMSVETTKSVFNALFKGLPISTGWIHKQDEILAKECIPVVENIKEYLSNVKVAHADETGVKIDTKLGSCICFSNLKAVVYGIFSNKSKESFDEFEVFNKFSGILMHDHNKTYYMYAAMEHAECNVHICRYLQFVIDMFQRNGAKKLKEFLLNIYKEKLTAISEGKTGFSDKRITEIEEEYFDILNKWEKEYNESIKDKNKKTRALKEEYNLFTRLKEYFKEHLRFVKDFQVPFSNNEAERNLRKIKIKLNISKKFGNLECARNFAIIKSIIETAKKQNMDILYVFSEILAGNHNVFDLQVD